MHLQSYFTDFTDINMFVSLLITPVILVYDKIVMTFTLSTSFFFFYCILCHLFVFTLNIMIAVDQLLWVW